jgi:hypothetical protein
MKVRHVFSTPNLPAAARALQAAREAGVPDADLSLIARHDIELDKIPDDRKIVDMDIVPAALRGSLGGGVAGLLAGVVALSIPPLGITLAGAGALALAGALVGTWSAALVGASVPDPVRQEFEGEIEAGRILVVIDGEAELLSQAEPAVSATGARRLDFSAATALT